MNAKDQVDRQRLERDCDEAIEGIRRGLAEAEAGNGRPVREAIVSIRKKYRIPGAVGSRKTGRGLG